MMQGAVGATRLRKCMVGSMYDKLTQLSMKSLTETNSGKLVTMVSGDLAAIERPLAICGALLAAPFINLTAYVVLGLTSGWEFAAVAFVMWLLVLFCQDKSSKLIKKFQALQSKTNDVRVKLINDMVNGARTIKCYGWENHFLAKLVAARRR